MPDPLVVLFEPDKMQRDLMLVALNRSNISVEVCLDPVDLPGLLEIKQPPVLVMDLYLPGMNGLDLMVDLKGRGLLDATKVIGISSMAFPEVVRKMVQAGFADFLVKPLDTDQFIARVQRALQRNQAA